MPQSAAPNAPADADRLEVATDQAIAGCGGEPPAAALKEDAPPSDMEVETPIVVEDDSPIDTPEKE